MDLIYTNANGVDLGVLSAYAFDLSFGASENDFEIIACNEEVAINSVNNDKNRYEFHYNGKDNVTTDTAMKITIGQVKFTGYGKFNFVVDGAANTTNAVHATKLFDNIVDTFVATNGLNADIVAGDSYLNIENIIEDVINLPLRNLAINITFPNRNINIIIHIF